MSKRDKTKSLILVMTTYEDLKKRTDAIGATPYLSWTYFYDLISQKTGFSPNTVKRYFLQCRLQGAC